MRAALVRKAARRRKAAIDIQRVFRGFRCRLRLWNERRVLNAKLKVATWTQARWRGYKCKIKYQIDKLVGPRSEMAECVSVY
jgi:hypothetical protein